MAHHRDAGGREGSLRLLAFDVASGRSLLDVELFRLRNSALLNPKNSLASPTPIIEGDRVYVHFGAEGTAAVSTSRRGRLEDANPVRIAARQRRVAGALWRRPDLQL